MWYAWGRGILLGNRREGGHFEEKGVDGMIILKWISKIWEGRAWT